MWEGLLTPETLDFFFRYVLAGYIFLIVRNFYLLGARPALAEVALDIVVLSLLNQAAWLLLRSLALGFRAAATAASPEPAHFAAMTLPPTLSLFLETMILPALLGVLLGRALRRGDGRGLARRLGMAATGPNQRVYDEIFSNQTDPAYMILTLDDGTVVYGYYGARSRAGRDRQKEEIYFEEIFDARGPQWTAFDPPRGALVNLAKLRSIEILRA